MTDRPCCSVGARGDVAAIDKALRSGEGVRVIAKRLGLGKSALGDHRKNCLGLQRSVVADAPPLDQENPADTSPDASADTSRTVEDQRPNRPRTSGDDARAREIDPNPLPSYDDRVLYVADTIVRGRWLGRRTAKRLAALWGVDHKAVQNYHRAAAVVCKADRGSIEDQRETSIGVTMAIRERARLSAKKNQELIERCINEGNDIGEAIARKALAEDRQNELAAQQHLDRIAGVLANAAPSVNINVMSSPEVVGLLRVQGAILDTLFPGASAAMLVGVEVWRTKGTPGLQAWLEERRRDRAALLVEAG